MGEQLWVPRLWQPLSILVLQSILVQRSILVRRLIPVPQWLHPLTTK
jgi:hypothetical protein